MMTSGLGRNIMNAEVGSRMAGIGDWVQPPQNTIEALRHGIEMMDGIEFDLRMTSDGELFLHHNSVLECDALEIENAGAKSFFEENDADTIRRLGFESFNDLLDDRVTNDAWLKRGATLLIELKRPHRSSRPNGTMSRRLLDDHMLQMLKSVDKSLEQHGSGLGQAAIISFYQSLHRTGLKAGTKTPIAPISPYLPTFGTPLTKRVIATPLFVGSSVTRLARTHKKLNTPILPLAFDYLAGFTRLLHAGRPVGLTGRGLDVLRRANRIKTMASWPTPLLAESALDSVGIWRITDEVNPRIERLPDGLPRWTRPATQPLDSSWRERFEDVRLKNEGEVTDLLDEAKKSVAPWVELTASEKQVIYSERAKACGWNSESTEPLKNLEERGVPWRLARSIAHRGAGKSRSEN
jgi:glycerophosphoryl diester phosphodiesterase